MSKKGGRGDSIWPFADLSPTMMHSNQAEADLKEENKANTPNNDALVAQFCIDEMSRPCPPVSFFRQIANQGPPPPPTLDTIHDRLLQDNDRHREDLGKLYDFQARQRELLHLHYRAFLNCGDYYPELNVEGPRGDDKKSKLPTEIWAANYAMWRQTLDFNDTISAFDTAFNIARLPLYQQTADLRTQAIAEQEHQLRVARWLNTGGKSWLPPSVLNKLTQDAKNTLLKTFREDPKFQDAVKKTIDGIQGTDPRKRLSAGTPLTPV